MVQKSPHSKNKWKKVSYLPPLRQSQGPWWEMLFGVGVATHGAGRKQKKDNFLLFYIIIFSFHSSLSLFKISCFLIASLVQCAEDGC